MSEHPSFGAVLVFVVLLLIAGGSYVALCFGLAILMDRLKRSVQRRHFLRPRTKKIIVVYFSTQAVMGLAWMLVAVSTAGSKTSALIELFAILAFVCVTGLFGALSFGGCT